MNHLIINNLYEFWSYIGIQSNLFMVRDELKAVAVSGSDWPKRIFDVSPKADFSDILKKIHQGKLPNLVTMPQPNNLNENPQTELISGQKNMALNLKSYDRHTTPDPNIVQVKTKQDADKFAQTASLAFGYNVDGEIVHAICNDNKKIQLYNYVSDSHYLGCGGIFFDSGKLAGLHMIGTIPNSRKMGIAKSMTQYLIQIAKINDCDFCVLHASKAGEAVYLKLGFKGYGDLETYKVR
ncbi:GNAT family N-acetyltransferase [Saccharicrinis sp. GN24d3]|uniref:GNAT family N-acetyltransferase n=1 Tax=Saccharicrinis sp. GN24d3 TaxID=3458416 RepID=UPI0040354043